MSLISWLTFQFCLPQLACQLATPEEAHHRCFPHGLPFLHSLCFFLKNVGNRFISSSAYQHSWPRAVFTSVLWAIMQTLECTCMFIFTREWAFHTWEAMQRQQRRRKRVRRINGAERGGNEGEKRKSRHLNFSAEKKHSSDFIHLKDIFPLL